MLETSLLPREKRVDGGLDTGTYKTLEDLEGDTQQRDRSIDPWITWELIWLKDCKTSALLKILRLCKQEERNLHNQDFISEPA